MNQPIRVAIVDDHKLMRSGLTMILNSKPEFQVVLEAANGEELLEQLDDAQPEVILLDLEMPVTSGREALVQLRLLEKDVKVLILTMHQQNDFIVRLLEQGANGYLIKDTGPDEVVKAICQVHQNGFYFSERVSMAMLANINDRTKSNLVLPSDNGLSSRDKDILRLICQERTTTEIADTLFLSPKTIEGYRKSLMEKAEARNMAGLVLFAVRNGLAQ